jgi:hypothetical protein
MSKKMALCIATSLNQADQIVERLKTANFSNGDISALFADKNANRDFAHRNNTQAPERVAIGGLVGGALGWIAGIGALAIPGAGPFIAAGPIMATLSGAATGGIAGALMAMGIPEIEAKRYEGEVKEGNVLVSVHTDDAGDLARAKDLFQQAGSQDVCTAGGATTRKQRPSTERGERPFEVSAA